MRIEIANIDSLKDDISKLFGNRAFSKEERQWFAKAFIREILKARHYRPSNEVPRVEGDVIVEPVLYEPLL